MQLHKQAIVSHSVKAPTLERILNSMFHPTQEEMDQQEIHSQELNLKPASQPYLLDDQMPPAVGMW